MVKERARTTEARARELDRRAERLMLAGDGLGAMAAIEEAIGLTIHADDPGLAALGRWLLLRKADSLAAMTAYQEAVDEYDRLIADAARAPKEEGTRLTALVLGQRAIALGGLLRTDDAVAGFDSVVDRFGQISDPEVRSTVASALYNKAIVLRDADRRASALEAFDEVGRRVGDDRTAEGQQWAALAMFNKAGLLADLGRLEESLELYWQVTAQFADSPSEMARERAARASGTRATLLMDAGRIDDALVEYRNAADRFAAASEPEVRAMAAGALLAIADLLGRNGRSAEAIGAIDEMDRRFATDQAPEVHEVVAFARQLREPAPSVSHAWADPLALARHDEAREGVARYLVLMAAVAGGALLVAIVGFLLLPVEIVGKVLFLGGVAIVAILLEFPLRRRLHAYIDYVETNLAHIRAEAEAQAEQDATAQAVVAEFEADGTPFALYLRSFQIEGTRRLIEEDGRPLWVSHQQVHPSELEAALAPALKSRIPIIGIQNPSDSLTQFTAAIPKLALPDDGWRDALEKLVAAAEFIVMHPIGLSPGVTAELTAIAELEREQDTVVVIGSASDNDSTGILTAVTGAALPDHERLAVASPELASFQRVVFQEDISFEALGEHPLFADLLERAAWQMSLGPEQRREARNARLAEDQAGQLLHSGDRPTALRRLQEARRVQQRLGDRLGSIATLHAIGVVRLEAGDVPGATSALEEALEACDEKDIVSTGPILRLLGVCRNDVGQLEEAIALLRRAVDTLAIAGSRHELFEALGFLGQLYVTQGNPAPAADLLARAAALVRDSGDDAGLVMTLADLGGALLATGRLAEAREVLTESVERIRASSADDDLAEFEPVALAYLALASKRLGAMADAERYAAEAGALPVGTRWADVVRDVLDAVGPVHRASRVVSQPRASGRSRRRRPPARR